MATDETGGGNQMWGGRFDTRPDQVMEEINASIDFDKRLAVEDIRASQAHARMLAAQGVITSEDAVSICDGLARIEAEIAEGAFKFSRALEDIHMNVEARLTELIGAPAGRLHTGRSRNDQVATDFKLWVRGRIDQTCAQLDDLIAALLDQAEAGATAPMPGFTHLQFAQPVSWGHHMMAYVEMFGRDRARFLDARARLNECPLGAAALAGTSFPIDRDATAAALEFDRPTANSLDTVSDRDFALDFLSAASVCATHLSRFAEEIVIWCSGPFRYVALTDAFSTGSSIMPQKRNPDAAELVRAKTGRINGALLGLLTVMKGLPLAYSKDMQEDKERVFESADALALCLVATAGMVRDMTPNFARLRADAASGHALATDLADALVRELKTPFREAHHVVGALVKLAERDGRAIEQLSLKELRSVEPRITLEIAAVLDLDASLRSRQSYGGAAPDQVRAQIARWRAMLDAETTS